MDTETILILLKESVFVITVFGLALAYAMIRGKQAIINLILGMYMALLLTLEFPYFDALLGPVEGESNESIVRISVFIIFTVITTILFSRLMPREFDEKTFQGFGKKFIFALAATILVMAFSYHTLPVLEFVDPGTPIQYLFAPEHSFFVWLIAPLALLFLL